MAAAATMVEPTPLVRSRRRYKQRRKPRAAVLRRGRWVAAGLIFKLGMGLVLSLAALGAW